MFGHTSIKIYWTPAEVGPFKNINHGIGLPIVKLRLNLGLGDGEALTMKRNI